MRLSVVNHISRQVGDTMSFMNELDDWGVKFVSFVGIMFLSGGKISVHPRFASGDDYILVY